MNVSDLTVAHLGQRVRVTTETDESTGVLYGINVRAGLIDDSRINEARPRYMVAPVCGVLIVGAVHVPVVARTSVEVLA